MSLSVNPNHLATPALTDSGDAKDSREVLRSRKLHMKPHDRAKARTSRAANRTKHALAVDDDHIPARKRNGGQQKQHLVALDREDGRGLEVSVEDLSSDDNSPTMDTIPLEPAEVPLLTMLRSNKPWDGVGADFELVSNPDDVIALDDDIAYSDTEWDQVDDFAAAKPKKGPKASKSYATAAKTGLKHN